MCRRFLVLDQANPTQSREPQETEAEQREDHAPDHSSAISAAPKMNADDKGFASLSRLFVDLAMDFIVEIVLEFLRIEIVFVAHEILL